jgi:tetratricopeptide (TPR) repeat protein
MHDLIRLYAADHLTDDQRAAAFTRVLSHYRRTAYLAERRFTALPNDVDRVPAGFATPTQAMAWVLVERAGLVATVSQSAIHSEETAWLAAALAPFVSRARLLADWVTVATAVVQASPTIPDRTAAAMAWNNFGLALWQVRRFDEAITVLQRAGEIFQETGDRHYEAVAENNLGIALQEVRRFDEAITAHPRAREIFQGTGAHHNEAMAENNLGLALREVRRFDEAITAYRHAICAELDDRYGQAQTLANLGAVYAELDQAEQARRVWTDAVELFIAAGAEDNADRVRRRLAGLDRKRSRWWRRQTR